MLKQNSLKKPLVIMSIALIAGATVSLTGCANEEKTNTSSTTAPIIDNTTVENGESTFDYTMLVNKQNAVQDPASLKETMASVSFKNSCGESITLEASAYGAYQFLKDELAEEGVDIDVKSGYRSLEDQQRLWDESMAKHGEEYTATHVAAPGYSEHHTGLALDLYFRIDGRDIVMEEELNQHPEIWEKIHSKLASNGFILRYPDGAENITGYSYAPGHIRYIDDIPLAEKITSDKTTFEQYIEANGGLPLSESKSKNENLELQKKKKRVFS